MFGHIYMNGKGCMERYIDPDEIYMAVMKLTKEDEMNIKSYITEINHIQ